MLTLHHNRCIYLYNKNMSVRLSKIAYSLSQLMENKRWIRN